MAPLQSNDELYANVLKSLDTLKQTFGRVTGDIKVNKAMYHLRKGEVDKAKGFLQDLPEQDLEDLKTAATMLHALVSTILYKQRNS